MVTSVDAIEPAAPEEPACSGLPQTRSPKQYARSLADAEAGPSGIDELSPLPPAPVLHARHRVLQQGAAENGSDAASTPEFEFSRTQSEPNLHAGPKLGSARRRPVRQPTRPALISKAIFEPKKPLRPPPDWRTSLKNTVRYSYLSVLLIFIPISWAMHFSHQSPTVTFCCSFAAIVPLAALLGFATEEMALRVGDTFGGLLNATFGNCVELIVSILALVKGELGIVRSSMLGSILSNCLLVLGMCFFAGGLRFHEQGYTTRAAQLNINLLGISVTAIVIPVTFHAVLASELVSRTQTTEADLLSLSRGIAFILLFVYGSYLTFQLWTHAYLYLPQPRGENDPPPPPVLPFIEGPQPPKEGGVFRLPSWGSSSSSSSSDDGEEDDHHLPKLSLWFALCLLLAITVLTGFTAEWLVSSISGLTASGNISTEFVALILLPLVGNAAEHVTAVTVATKNKLDLSMSVAVGSSIQIALFVIPVLVLLAWTIGQPLDLGFDLFETVVLFVSIVSVNWAIADGRTNWLEGVTLMVIYVIIALVFWYYPGVEGGVA